VNFQCARGKFTDKDLRQAMMIGTDLEAIRDAVYVEGAIQASYGGPGAGACPSIEELPASTKLLYTYDPDLAKQMIADASYPDGFDMTMTINSAKNDEVDLAALLVDQWAKIGVNLTLISMETTAHQQIRSTREFEDAHLEASSLPTRVLIDYMTIDHASNPTGLVDQYTHDGYFKAAQMVDTAERNAIFKDLVIHHLDTCSRIQMPAPYVLVSWWQWVKNYYGETEAGYLNLNPMLSRMWIDQDLKAEMGY